MNSKALKSKLSLIWSIPESEWILTPLGKGFYNLDMKTMDAQSRVFVRGTLFLKPGVLRISRWVPNFNPYTQKLTNSQVWIRIFGLSLEYWRPSLLFDISKGVGMPLRIDDKTLKKELGIYARILVDIDFARDLPEKILVQHNDNEFFVNVEYECLPMFCKHCGGIGHCASECRLINAQSTQTGERFRREKQTNIVCDQTEDLVVKDPEQQRNVKHNGREGVISSVPKEAQRQQTS